MKTSHFLFLLSICLSFSCSVNWTVADQPKMTISQADKDLIDDMFDAFSGNKPGASIMIAKGDELVYSKNFGLANRETLAVPTNATNYRIGSVSKQFTAMGILILVDQGKIKLESKLADIFPDFPSYGKDITIQQLLTHQSGLPNYMRMNTKPGGGAWNDKDVMDYVMNANALLFSNGSKMQYSNTGYALLALIIEKTSGQSFESFMRTNVFDPAEMDNTVFNSTTKDIPYRAYGNRVENGKAIFDDQSFSSYIMGDGSIYTSVNDYFKWHMALNKEMLISKDLQSQAYSPQNGTSGQYGYGWFTPSDRNGIKWVRHSGGTAGFITQSARIPSEGITVAIFTNRGSSDSDPAAQHLGIRAEALLSIATGGRFPMPEIEKQLQSESKKSLANSLLEEINSNGLAAGLKFYNANKNDKTFYLDHQEMTDGAYALIDSGSQMEGLAVLKLINTEFSEMENPVNTGVVIDVSEQLANGGAFEIAHAYADFLINAYPSQERSWRAKAQVYHKENKLDLAVEYYKKAAERDPYRNLWLVAFKEGKPYQKSILPTDTTALFEARGNMESDTVFVFAQGGPLLNHQIGNYDPLKDIPNSENYMKVYTYQTQMLNPDLVITTPPMNAEQTLYEVERTSEMLARTVDYFKLRGKTVYVLGHSYGLTISMDYLLNKKNNADHIVMMAGHFNVDLRNFERDPGKIVRWRNGEEPYQRPFFRGIEDNFPAKPQLDNVLDNVGALVHYPRLRRYTDLLKDKDLSNVTYVHARYEEASGRATQKELDFAKSKGVSIMESFTDHHGMLTPVYLETIYNHITKGTQLKMSPVGALSKDIELKGIDYAISQFDKYRDENQYLTVDENELNTLGYYLLGKEQVPDAIKVFKLNADSFPDSWNAYDSLGEAYLAAGDKVNARTNYEKSVALNPENQYGIEALAKMKE